MSDSFLVAARIPMTRDGFERWLSTPVADLSAIANPADMFDGWLWDGRRADTEWDSADTGTTPREYFAERAEGACSGKSVDGVLVYRDGALEAYLLHLGYRERSIHTALLLLAATGPFTSGDTEDTVLFWAETGAGLWDADDDGWLAVLSVGRSGARFVDARDLTGTVAGLRPVEDRFFEMVERLAEEEESWAWDSGRDFRTETPRDPAFTDPSVLERPGPR
ncbi:hypothetical protein ABZ490_49095 [Streptomyces sp. NPDC005811]|uniref:hypothetical protein n=1 Tax=Streptomyces sp. NPDC005811 TaxID=3154565 RepID=UPI00340B0162